MSTPTCRNEKTKTSPDRKCASPPQSISTSASAHKSRSKSKSPSTARRVARLLVRKTWLGPLLSMLLIVSAYLINPTPSNPVHHALFLSYPQWEPLADGGAQLYGKGNLDFVFVAFYTIWFTFTREFLMRECLTPLAIKFNLKNKGKITRFNEQLYTAIYFTVFGPFGMYVMKMSGMWWFETRPMYEGYPHKILSAEFKLYYLLQGAYWAQQALVLVLRLEKPRKDFNQLILHHIVTLALIYLSYRFHFTNIGLLVYITHDVSDWFLATSKVMNYLDCVLVGPFLMTFIFVWGYMRHYINLRILWSLLTEMETVGSFELNWETQQYKCWISQYITFALLATLQSVNCYWYFLILRIAKNYVFAGVKKDERSCDEDSDADSDSDSDSEVDAGDKEKESRPGRRRGSSRAMASALSERGFGLRERTNSALPKGHGHAS